MRPLELSLRNFRSYYGETAPFDFRGRGLVGVVGPIGSGKSSLLDAIAFALYAKTPAGGAQTKGLIHQRASDGAVSLRFEVEGEVWEVVRSLRRRGASQHALYRYEDDTPEAEPIERIVLEGDVNEKIVSLLGLDYDAFGRSVMLAQGRFSEFLRSRPAERDAVLKGVFGHDRLDLMREIARQRVSGLAADLGKLSGRTEQLESVAARVAVSKTELAAAEQRLEALRKAEPKVVDLGGRIAAADTTHAAAVAQLDELARHAGRLPNLGATERLVADASALEARRRRLALELEAAQRKLTEAENVIAAADATDEAQLLEDAARLLAASDPQRRTAADTQRRREVLERRVEEETRRKAEAGAALRAAEDAAAAGEAALVEAAALAQAAEEFLHAAQHGNMATALRATLAEGEPCPVCDQNVGAIPAADSGVDMASAEASLVAARSARTTAEATRSGAVARVSAATEAVLGATAGAAALERELEQATRAEQEASADLEGTMERIRGVLGEGEPATLLDERKRRQTARADAATEARREVEQVRSRHDQVILDEQAVGKQLSSLRVELADLTARLGRPVDAPVESPADLGRAAADLRQAWSDATASLERSIEASDRDKQKAASERADLLAGLGVEGDFSGALGAAAAKVESLGVEVARDTAEIDAAETLLKERDRVAEEHLRYQRIASDLTDSHFVRFLLDDERARLADLGSDHFQRLSGGRYRFTEDGTFSIIDLTSADAERKASSLSGGETFLASLALALSLAEMVARTGGRLDAFFLDEGFGSLDPEHLDLAMDGVEALVADNSSRLVVVVSHVSEMRHRIEDLIELDRDALTGDTRIVRS